MLNTRKLALHHAESGRIPLIVCGVDRKDVCADIFEVLRIVVLGRLPLV